MEFDYGMELYGEELAVFGGLIAVVLIVYLLLLAFSVVSYVLQALGMYTIAKRRGLHHPWLAWVPVGNMWLLGCISDQYQYVVKGRVRSRRKSLLWLTVAMLAASVLVNICSVALMLSDSHSPAVWPAVILLLVALAMMVVAVIAVVLQYMATYDMFVSCDPNNAVLYLVLSIFIGVTMPFFVFASRNKDLGMPRRKAPQPAAPVVPEPVPEEETPDAMEEAEAVSEVQTPAQPNGEETQTAEE